MTDSFSTHSDFIRKIDQLIKDPGLLAKACRAYKEIIQDRGTICPLLIDYDDEGIKLARKPAFVYLLPPARGFSDEHNQRLILCQYSEEPTQKQSLQLIKWSYSKNNKGHSRLTILNSGLWPIKKTSVHGDDKEERINEKANKITLKSDDPGIYKLSLQFASDNYTLMFKVSNDATHLADYWTESEETHPGITWEKASFDNMDVLVGLKRNNNEKNWMDDRLVDHEGKEYPQVACGHILGADAQSGSDRIYLASSRARIYCLDKQSRSICFETSILGGICYDVLAIGKNKKSSNGCLLTCCSDGLIWLLEDSGTGVKPRVFQYQKEKVVRLIGFGSDQIVTLNQSDRLIPQRVINQGENKKKIQAFYQLAWQAFRNEEASVKSDYLLPAFQAYLDRLFGFQLALKGFDKTHVDWLALVLEDIASYREPQQTNFNLHYQLLEILWKTIQKWVYTRTDVEKSRIEQGLWAWEAIFCLLDIVEHAPTSLWLSVFRQNDWLGLLEEELNTIDKPLKDIGDKLLELTKNIHVMRNKMNVELASARPILVESSVRIASEPRHIRIVDVNRREKTKPDKLIAFIDFRKGLRLMRFPERDGLWKNLALIAHNKEWKGIPRALATGKQLQAMLPEINTPLILGTDRGEVVLCSIIKTEIRVVEQFSTDMEIRTIHVIDRDEKRQAGVLLVAGQNRSQAAEIRQLRLNYHSAKSVLECRWIKLWTSERTGGLVRMLCVLSTDTTQNIFAVDRGLGTLLYWSWSAKTVNKLGSPVTLLKNQNNLHALAANSYENATQLISGAKDGIALAFSIKDLPVLKDSNHEFVPQWITGCNKRLNRAIFLTNNLSGKHKEYCLLCSESSDVLLVKAKTGETKAVLEHLGPVTAARKVELLSTPGLGGAEQALLGSSNGRIVLTQFKSSKNEDSPIVSDQRCVENDSLLALKEPEGLVLLMLLLDCDPKELIKTTWLHKINPILLSILLKKNIADLVKKNLGNKILTIIKNNQSKFPDGPSCRTYRILHRLSDFYLQNNKQIPQEIREYLYEIWGIEKFAGEARKTNPSQSNYRLRPVRLGYATYHYTQICTNNEAESFNLNQWLKWLDDFWTMLDETKPLEKKALSRVEKLTLHLESLLKEEFPVCRHEWQQWMGNILKIASTSSNDADTNKPPDEVFGLLWPNKYLQPYQDVDLPGFKGLFKNLEWEAWVLTLQKIVLSLQASATAKPHVAWEELAKVESLRSHVLNEGPRIFVNDRGFNFPLLAFAWGAIGVEWESVINARIEQIDKHATNSEYVRIECETVWKGAQEIELRVTIINDGPRGIIIDDVYLESNDLHIKDFEKKKIETSPEGTTCTVLLYLKEPNKINEQIKVTYLNNIEGVIDTKYHYKNNRDIHYFSQNKEFFATGEYLDKLSLYDGTVRWLEGDFWDEDEEKGIDERSHIYEGANKMLSPKTSCVKISSLDLALNYSKDPLFCPDIPLSTENPLILVYRVHAILHDYTERQQLKPLALGLWNWARPLPKSIASRISSFYTSKQDCETVLGQLFDTNKQVDFFKSGMLKLPDKALGAWCSGDVLNNSNEEDYYNKWAGLGYELCSFLYKNNISNWSEFLTEYKEVLDHLMVSNLKSNQINKKLISLIENKLDLKFSRNNEIWQSTCNLNILDLDFKNCLLISSEYEEDKLHDISRKSGMTLVFQFIETWQTNPLLIIPDLKCLTLNRNHIWQLLVGTEPLELMSEWLAMDNPIHPRELFQENDGMHKNAVLKHFYGRKTEVSTLNRMLESADKGLGTSYLILGSRKIGKTSLRQYIISYQALHKPERIIFTLDCSGAWTTNSEFIERDFIRECLRQLKELHPSYQPKYTWAFIRNTEQQANARDCFVKILREIKQKTGLMPLLFFDETDKLGEYGDSYIRPFIQWLRSIVNQDNLIWFVNAYPFGSAIRRGLENQNTSQTAPFYNTLKHTIRLTTWDSVITWDFLQSKLALLGIRLPGEYKKHVWEICRGLPWVVTKLAIEIADDCKTGRRSLVTPALFNRAKNKTRKAFFADFENSIVDAAKLSEKELGKGASYLKGQLSDGQLVRVLRTLAKKYQDEPFDDFTLVELHQLFGKHKVNKDLLKKALGYLSSSQVVNGVEKRETYQFSGGLYPKLLEIKREKNV